MNQIIPFRDSQETLASLDNGGRFYNLLSRAEDGNISFEELSRVAGLFTNKQQVALFYAMSTTELGADDRQKVSQALSNDLKIIISQHMPQELTVAEAHFGGKVSGNAIVSGYAGVFKELQLETNDRNTFFLEAVYYIEVKQQH